MYFPQLIAGPIVHHTELIPQLRQRLRISVTDLSAGLCLFTMGLLKKIMFADPLAHLANSLFGVAAAGQGPSMLVSWTAALSFAFQIYFDFSGYTDMALGLALMMGIRLPLNFNSPYKALNIIDFWRRWHMTLSRFLRDYVYIPLGGNRHGPHLRYINLMLTMLLGGLWHGAAWTFVIWGGLHGLYLVVNHAWHTLRPLLGFTKTTAGTRTLSRLVTFGAVLIAWVFFRAQGVAMAKTMLKGMFGFYGIAGLPQMIANTNPFWSGGGFVVALAMLGILWAGLWTLPNSQEIFAAFTPAQQPAPGRPLFRSLLLVRWGFVTKDGQLALTATLGLIVAGTLLGAMVLQTFKTTTLQPFIYFQF